MKIYQVDSFSDRAFGGNPAGVCVLLGPADENWMQNVAMEMNLAETAFLYRQGEIFKLRWFTPEDEENLCGHATLASAHILWETGVLEPDCKAVFKTRSGILSAVKKNGLIEMDFPSEASWAADAPEDLKQALGVPFLYVGRNRLDYIVEVDNEETVRKLEPEYSLLKKLDARGVIVTSCSDSPEFDFVSRFFAPVAGINEDPVTGSAHCCLAPYWGKKLGIPEMNAYQASKRGGALKVTVNGDRVLIAGKAVTVFSIEANC
ncbi:MAG TPA: PhzF family phenazine biosynthesis protein [Clostridia bacterium]|nr:PhzF family phenazine biosynthesis protein [Clostridia bacterium]